MSEELFSVGVAKIHWRLRQTMAYRKVTNKALAERLGKHATTIARLKAVDTLPEIGGEAIEQIRAAISDLSQENFGVCSLSELIQLED